MGIAAALREARTEAAPRLADAVRAELADLAMARADLRIELVEDDAEVPDDACVIWLRANPGLPEAPLAATASGGELSRVLLALHGVAAARDDATWVLDEVNAGIGGVTAAAVGARLRALAEGRQTVVITHLPQVAAMADAHYRLVKGLDAGGRATTRIEPVEGDELIAELCRMLGATPSDRRGQAPRRRSSSRAGASRRRHDGDVRRDDPRGRGRRRRTSGRAASTARRIRRRLAAIGRDVGHQVRISAQRRTSTALYTVSETRQETPDGVVRMGAAGQAAARDERGVRRAWSIRRCRTRPSPRSEAEAEGEFIERLRDDGRQRRLIAIAPHGGDIEPRTDAQAERVRSRLGAGGSSAWRCKGWDGDGARLRALAHHLHRHRRGELPPPRIGDRPAASPMPSRSTGSTTTEILIGGTRAPGPEGGDQVRPRARDGRLAHRASASRGPTTTSAATSRRNIVNRLSAGGAGGIQIEQSPPGPHRPLARHRRRGRRRVPPAAVTDRAAAR